MAILTCGVKYSKPRLKESTTVDTLVIVLDPSWPDIQLNASALFPKVALYCIVSIPTKPGIFPALLPKTKGERKTKK
jgi:hypothetical protein